LEDTVKLPPVADFPLPAFTGSLDVGSFTAATVRGDASPVAPRGFHLPATGVAPVDSLGSQVASAFGTLQAALETANATVAGGLPLGGLPTDELPVELPVPVTGLPPLGIGSFPGQAQGASDAADPDEKGAAVAGAHAAALLKSVEDAYAVGKPSLAGLLAGYQGLAGQVQALVDEARNATQHARTSIQAELVRRVTAIQEEGDRAQKQAAELVAGQRKGLEGALASAQASLEASLDAQVAAVRSAVLEDSRRLDGLAAQVSSQVQATQQRIQSIVDGAVANLTRVQGADTTATVEAIQAAGVQAVHKVTQDGRARALEIKQAATSLQARGEAAVRQLTQAKAAALATLEEAAQDALGRSEEAQAYLVALARAKANVAEAAETAAATLALGKLPGLESAQVAKVTKAGLALVASSGNAVLAVERLVGQVGDATSEQVEKDIRYVEGVSKDYAKVPTGERLERAKAWSAVATLVEGRLGQVLETTDQLAVLASQVAHAADAAKAQIEGMA
ncbi:MAG TPA: hypothetical protein VHI93_00415, partial [Candidatus Thermoplasmatota archaeon]|nr:hypothetical protein [Candidatus Thermoplasmatota archaeon]